MAVKSVNFGDIACTNVLDLEEGCIGSCGESLLNLVVALAEKAFPFFVTAPPFA